MTESKSSVTSPRLVFYACALAEVTQINCTPESFLLSHLEFQENRPERTDCLRLQMRTITQERKTASSAISGAKIYWATVGVAMDRTTLQDRVELR